MGPHPFCPDLHVSLGSKGEGVLLTTRLLKIAWAGGAAGPGVHRHGLPLVLRRREQQFGGMRHRHGPMAHDLFPQIAELPPPHGLAVPALTRRDPCLGRVLLLSTQHVAAVPSPPQHNDDVYRGGQRCGACRPIPQVHPQMYAPSAPPPCPRANGTVQTARLDGGRCRGPRKGRRGCTPCGGGCGGGRAGAESICGGRWRPLSAGPPSRDRQGPSYRAHPNARVRHTAPPPAP